MTTSNIGNSVPRRDLPEKLTGDAKYTSDIKLPGMLHGKILRSPYPHARIVSVDATKAARLPGVHARRIYLAEKLSTFNLLVGRYGLIINA